MQLLPLLLSLLFTLELPHNTQAHGKVVNAQKQPLSSVSMPSTEKYHQVLRDEELRNSELKRTRTPEEDVEHRAGYERHQFNQYISDRLPLHRRSYDTRAVECLHEKYHTQDEMGDASVVIIFYNEAVSTLLRTAWSVVDRTPPALLHEVLLVDDGSTRDDLQAPSLDDMVAQIPKTRVVRLPERVGLIQAKVRGAQEASGRSLVFLDSHCECNDGWLEPLLSAIADDSTTVAIPVIDAIEANTFEHRTSILQRGMFSWSLTFTWQDLTSAENTARASVAEELVSPAMAGGIFAMDREYFWEIGGYDEGMETWGGENIEMSFRVWMCGGSLVTFPCSRVGHVFRSKSPYSFNIKKKNGGSEEDATSVIGRNLNRVAAVWMDEYAEIYYKASGNKHHGYGNDESLNARRLIRKNLQCRNFSWYLDTVAVDMFVPLRNRAYQAGQIASWYDSDDGVRQCAVVTATHDEIRFNSQISMGVEPCTNTKATSQRWYLTKLRNGIDGQVRLEDSMGSRCMWVDKESVATYLANAASAARAKAGRAPVQDRRKKSEYDDHSVVVKGGVTVIAIRCHDQEWTNTTTWHLTESHQVVHDATGLCLTSSPASSSSSLTVATCTPNGKNQMWQFVDLESGIDDDSESDVDDIGDNDTSVEDDEGLDLVSQVVHAEEVEGGVNYEDEGVDGDEGVDVDVGGGDGEADGHHTEL